MARVSDNEADIIVLGKVDRFDNILGTGNIDSIVNIVAQGAGPGLRLPGVT